MTRSTRLLTAAAVLCLVPPADSSRAADPKAPPDARPQSSKELDRLAQQLDELELAIRDERVKVRKEVLEKEARLRALERAFNADGGGVAAEIRKLEGQARDIEASVTAPEANKLIPALRKRIQVLTAEREKEQARLDEARLELLAAEEQLRYTERRHDNQRRFLNLKIDAVEAGLTGGHDPATKRKLDRLEAQLEALLRETAELRRELGRKKDEK